MDLQKELKYFVNDKNETIPYYQIFVVVNGVAIAIKPIFKSDKKYLELLASEKTENK